MFAFLVGALICQEGLLQKIVPLPTGRNGYEEYLKAAEYASTDLFKVYANWVNARPVAGEEGYESPRPPDLSEKDSDLSARRKWVARFHVCCDLIERGNAKPVFDPRGGFDPETTFPEFASFKSLARLETSAARVNFADGQTGEGIKHLEDTFVFGSKMGSGILIGRLVGISCDAIAFRELNIHWAQLSLQDTQEVQRFFVSALSGPSPLVSSVEMERTGAHQLIKRILTGPPSAVLELFRDLVDPTTDQSLMTNLEKMSDNERSDLVSSADRVIDKYYDQLLGTLAGSESKWMGFADMEGDRTDRPSSISVRLASMFTPSYSGVLLAEERDRTMIRLAYLTAKAAEFRWVNGRLPKSIDEFTTLAERRDPTSGDSFRYVLDGPWFKVIRVAKDALGSQELGPVVQAAPGADSSGNGKP